jgi:cytoskeletal protein RodZ
MPTVAEQLRLAREAQGLTVNQVAEITKIKGDHIRALEAGEYDCFVAPVYIRGFARTYAKMLKLDEAQLSTELEQELSKTAKYSEPPPLTSGPRTPLDFIMLQVSRLNWRIALAVFVLVAVVIAALISFANRGEKEDPLKRLGPGQYQPTSQQSGETLPIPQAPPRR